MTKESQDKYIEPSKLRAFIINNHNHCALIIGNGINRCADSDCSWDSLLKSLAEEFFPQSDYCNEIPSGISNTEFFDVLELNFLRKTPTIDFEKIKQIVSNGEHTILSHIKDVDLIQIIKNENTNYHGSINDDNSELSTKTVSFSHLLTDDYLENLKRTMAIIPMGEKYDVLTSNKLVTTICSLMGKWTFSNIHKNLALFAKYYNLPILTTNYDSLLANSIGAELVDYGSEFSSESHPLSCCFTKDNTDFGKFAIWHINGTIKYPNSILIGLTHYMRAIEHVRNMLFSSIRSNVELLSGIYWDDNMLKNTWISHIFSKHLIIAGISLEENEVFLRWLLLERAKYFASYPHLTKDGYYLASKEDTISPGKKFFLKNVGINIVQFPDYDSIYNTFSL